MKRLLLVAVIMIPAATGAALAQPRARVFMPEEILTSNVAGEFFFALLVGVVLAIAFHLLLTNITLAGGLNAAHSVTDEDEDYHRDKSERGGGQRRQRDSLHRNIRKFSSLLGIWTLVTATISLFFAAWLAIELVPQFFLIHSIILGLAIWGLSYLIMMMLEMKAASSLVGSLTAMAGSALKGSGEAVKAVFSKSPESRLAHAGRDMAVALREEILQDHKVQDQLEDYLRQLRPPDISAEKLRKELEKLLDHMEIDAIVKDEGLDTEKITAWLRSGGVHPEEAEKAGRTLKQAVGKLRDEWQSDKREADKAFDSAMEVGGGMDREHAEQMRARLEEYLANLHDEQLDPEALKRDIETLFHDPRAGGRALRQRLMSIDRETLATIISDKTRLSHDRASHVIDTVMNVRDRLMGRAGEAQAEAAEKPEEVRRRAESKIQRYMDSLHRPELQYAGVKEDVKKLFHDPKAGYEALLNRAKRLDRETLRAVLISLPHMNRERADHVLDEVDKGRREVIAKAEKLRDEVEHRMEEARHEAIHQADQTRRTAATIAWWAFATALVSGGAAVLGGIVAFYT